MKFLKRIRHFIFGKPSELDYVKASLERHQNQLNDLKKNWPKGSCCPSCYYGRDYILLIDKIERIEKRLIYLQEKIIK